MLTKRESFIVFASSFIRVPYIWGGDSIEGIDCSGLVQILLEKLNLDPGGDQTADVLMDYFKDHGTKIEVANATLGDVCFYGHDDFASHVMMYIGDGICIGANGGGSKVTTPEIARTLNACVKFAQINYRKDLLCILRPHGLSW